MIIALSSTDGLLPISRPQWDRQRREAGEGRQPAQSFVLYRRCFGALSQAVAAQNKHLVIRVFPASNDDLSTVLDAIEPVSYTHLDSSGKGAGHIKRDTPVDQLLSARGEG